MAQSRPLFASLLAAALVPALASCAPGGTDIANPEPLNPKQAKLLDKQLGGKVAGAPVNCLSNTSTYDTIRVSDNILLYRSGSRLVYRNDLKGSCPGLARDSDIMVVRQFGSQTCSGDFFHLVDRSSGIRGPTCVLGDFVPYRKPAGDEG